MELTAWRASASPLGRSRRSLAAGSQTQHLKDRKLSPCGAFHGKHPQDPGGPTLPGDQTVPGPGRRSVPFGANKGCPASRGALVQQDPSHKSQALWLQRRKKANQISKKAGERGRYEEPLQTINIWITGCGGTGRREDHIQYDPTYFL